MNESDESLIRMVYDAARDPTQWQPFLAALAASFRGFYGHLGAVNPADGTLQFYQYVGIEDTKVNAITPRLLELIPDDPLEINNFDEVTHPLRQNKALCSARRIAAIKAGAAYRCREVVPDDSYRQSVIYRECRSPLDVEYLLLKRLVATKSLELNVGIARNRSAPPFSPEDCERLDRLGPHIRRAVDIHLRLEAFNAERRAAVAALETARVALVLVDGDGNVVHANSRARLLIGQRDGLALRGNRLFCDDIAAQRRLDRALNDATERNTAGSVVALSVLSASGTKAYALLVSRVWADRFSEEPVDRGGNLVGVFISSAADADDTDSEIYRDILGITDAQVRVLHELCGGSSLNEIAEAFDLSLNTVRAHVKAMLKAVGVSSQAELVRVALALTS